MEQIVFVAAKLMTKNVTAGSTTGGARASLKFQVQPGDTDGLYERIGQQSFDGAFDKLSIGKGVSIKDIAVRPDQDSGVVAYLTLVLPETSVGLIGSLDKVVGKVGQLVLDPEQLGFDLTAKAE